jgi:hypothetical protein
MRINFLLIIELIELIRMLKTINDQISEHLFDHLKSEILTIINDLNYYTILNDEHTYICAKNDCKKEIKFPEVPFLILNSEKDSYIAFHYHCAFKKDSLFFIHLSQFVNPCFLE